MPCKPGIHLLIVYPKLRFGRFSRISTIESDITLINDQKIQLCKRRAFLETEPIPHVQEGAFDLGPKSVALTPRGEPKCSLSFAKHLTLLALLLRGTSGFQLKVEVDDLGFPDASDARPL